jgi:MFS family permease
VLGLPFALAAFTQSLVALLALMFGAMFVSAGCVIVSLSEITDRHTTRHGAYLAGIGAGSWAALMVPATPLFGKLYDVGHFGVGYALAALCPACGWLVWRKRSRN